MDPVQEINRLATASLANESQFIVEVVVSTRKGPSKVLVIMDGDNGISIDDCAELSRKLSEELDKQPWLEESYTLEVSTPGLDQPLKLVRQYKKNIGRGLKVTRQDKTIVEGKLLEVSAEKIALTQEVGSGKKREIKHIEIPFSEIEKAFVTVSFK